MLTDHDIINLFAKEYEQVPQISPDEAVRRAGRAVEAAVREKQSGEIARLNDLVSIWKDTSRQADKKINQLREDESSARSVLVTGQLSRTYSGHALPANVEVQGQDEAQLRTVPLERPVGRKEE